MRPPGDWFRYRAQHKAVALALVPLVRAYARILRPHLPGPSPSGERELWRQFGELLRRDYACAQAGLYPLELLFQLPVRDYLGLALRKGPTSALLFHGVSDVLRRQALAPVLRALGKVSRPRLVDIGCGSGRLLWQAHRALPGAELYGIGQSEASLARARALLSDVPATLVAGAPALAALPDASFDAATLFCVLHEVDAPARREVLTEALRILKPGGLLVAADVLQCRESSDHNGLGYFVVQNPATYQLPHFKSYLDDPLPALLAQTRFAVESREQAYVIDVVAARRRE